MVNLYKKILVPLDGSDFAAQALAHAEILARTFGSSLELLRVVQDIETSVGLAAEFDIGRRENWQADLMRHAQESLATYAADLASRGIAATTRIERGDPSECIVDCAARDGVDLIVMTTHGRSGVARWVYGSVASRILNHAPCPLLLVRTQLA